MENEEELIKECGKFYNGIKKVEVYETGRIYYQDPRPLNHEEFNTRIEALIALRDYIITLPNYKDYL